MAVHPRTTGAAGWTQGVQHAMSDGILTRGEETNLRDFRDRMGDRDMPSVVTASATLGTTGIPPGRPTVVESRAR